MRSHSNSSVTVSVIIPCYNAEPWIAECLDSAIAQTHRPLEIIVIDDGSTDGSRTAAERVLQAGDVPYRVLTVSNGGPSRARNIGWRQAKGDWIQFLDADDVLEPDKIRRHTQAAVHLDDSLAVVYSEWQRQCWSEAVGQWVPASDVNAPQLEEPVVDLLGSRNFVHLGSALMCTKWLETVGGFEESMWLIEDVNLLVRIAIAGGKFLFVSAGKPMFYYRQRNDSLSRRDEREFLEGCMINLDLAKRWTALQGLSTARRAILIEAYAYVARSSYRRYVDLFGEAYAALAELARPNTYIPDSPRHLALASRLFGYPRAEWIAYRYRSLKRLLKGTRNSLRSRARS